MVTRYKSCLFLILAFHAKPFKFIAVCMNEEEKNIKCESKATTAAAAAVAAITTKKETNGELPVCPTFLHR